MSIILKMLFARWLTVIDVLRQFFSIYTPQPLLSIILPELIEGSSKFSSQIAHVPRIKDPSDYTGSVDLATICLVPTIFQTHLAVNFSCNDLDDTSSLYSSHHYVPLDFPVWRPVAPAEAQAKVSCSAFSQVSDSVLTRTTTRKPTWPHTEPAGSAFVLS